MCDYGTGKQFCISQLAYILRPMALSEDETKRGGVADDMLPLDGGTVLTI